MMAVSELWRRGRRKTCEIIDKENRYWILFQDVSMGNRSMRANAWPVACGLELRNMKHGASCGWRLKSGYRRGRPRARIGVTYSSRLPLLHNRSYVANISPRSVNTNFT
jgi:hypothetical protein